MDFIQRAIQMVLPPPETTMLVVTTAITTASLYTILDRIIHPRRPAVLQSPLSSHISGLSPEEKSGLLYPPDYFPGARDVPTPYGSIRSCTCRSRTACGLMSFAPEILLAYPRAPFPPGAADVLKY